MRRYGWGGGESGQNGHGFKTQVDKPKPIKGLGDVRFTHVAAGKLHSLALSRCTGSTIARMSLQACGVIARKRASLTLSLPQRRPSVRVGIRCVGRTRLAAAWR